MLLTHVCKKWHDVALDAVALWSRIVVPIWEEAPKRIDMLVSFWLKRVGDCPLNISIRIFGMDASLAIRF